MKKGERMREKKCQNMQDKEKPTSKNAIKTCPVGKWSA